MRNRLSISLMWVAIFALTANTVAQDFTHSDLPEGAKARLDKGTISEIAYSLDGKHLAVATGPEIWLYNAQTGEELDMIAAHADVVISIAFSPDSNTLMSGVSDGTVGTAHLWDVATGSKIRTLTGHAGAINVAFSPDGNTLASGSRDNTLRLWDVATGNEIQTLTGHTDAVIGTVFSPDGNTLASNGLDGVMLLWELASAAPEQLAEDVNKDGVVNILDLTLIASNFGKSEENDADVNADGLVNILDLTLVAAAFGNIAAVP
ncbi:MAG: dockerin type I domain-containing protein [Candidatus Poribacteria bacterium]|nr:dockerin type I domain-containing protein [Candidatus Poribacteria bacterium]